MTDRNPARSAAAPILGLVAAVLAAGSAYGQSLDAGLSDEGLPLPGFLSAGGALDAPTPDIVATIEAGVSFSPAYLGSDENEVGPFGSGRFDYVRFPGGFEFGSSEAVGFREGFGIRGSARYLGARDSSDYDEIRGLDDLDYSFEAGLGVGYERRSYQVFATARYGILGHNTWVGDVGADAIAYPADGLTLRLGPRLEFGTDRFADTYFGVTAEEAERSDLGEYDAEGGLLSVGMEFNAQYLFNPRWGVEGRATYARLLNDASDSPITEAGSPDQYELRLGLTRRISLDF